MHLPNFNRMHLFLFILQAVEITLGIVNESN